MAMELHSCPCSHVISLSVIPKLQGQFVFACPQTTIWEMRRKINKEK